MTESDKNASSIDQASSSSPGHQRATLVLMESSCCLLALSRYLFVGGKAPQLLTYVIICWLGGVILTYVVSFLAMLATQPPANLQRTAVPKSMRQEFIEGLRFTCNNSTLYAIIVVSVMISFGFSIFSALEVC
jgi:hypothetical protein